MRNALVLGRRRDVHATATALGGDGHELSADPTGLALGADVRQRHR